MAKRNRYREMENLMTKVILGDAAMTVLFLVFSRYDLTVLKIIAAVLAILCSALGLGWLFMTKELTRRRSLWMVTAFVCVLLLVIVSLLLGYPCPPVVG